MRTRGMSTWEWLVEGARGGGRLRVEPWNEDLLVSFAADGDDDEGLQVTIEELMEALPTVLRAMKDVAYENGEHE
jgi:hypothetical protein